MRQFGYVQSIPAPPVNSWVSFDEIDDRWMHYSDHFAPAGDMCVVPSQCAPDYISWFFVISHPFMTVAQTSNPPRDAPTTQPKHIPHIPQVPEPHIPQVPEPAAASTPVRSDVDEPKYVVVSVTIWLDV